jgi:hypothetical protein
MTGDDSYDCNGDYDCMVYYEVEGMTSCYEYMSCDEFGDYQYYCYMTIDGVDSEGACPDEWTGYDMYDDEDWDMTGSDMYYDDMCEYDYDCMDYYEVEGMTACYEYSTCDEFGDYDYYCYMTIGGVDSEGRCPDEWTGYDMTGDDWYYDDEDWDMTGDDEWYYDDECHAEFLNMNCQMWSFADEECNEVMFSYDSCDISDFSCESMSYNGEVSDCSEYFYNMNEWVYFREEEAWFAGNDSRFRDVFFFWNDTYTVDGRDIEDRCFTDCWVEDCGEDMSDCTYEVCYDCSYNLVYCRHTADGYASDCSEYYEEVNGGYSGSDEDCEYYE